MFCGFAKLQKGLDVWNIRKIMGLLVGLYFCFLVVLFWEQRPIIHLSRELGCIVIPQEWPSVNFLGNGSQVRVAGIYELCSGTVCAIIIYQSRKSIMALGYRKTCIEESLLDCLVTLQNSANRGCVVILMKTRLPQDYSDLQLIDWQLRFLMVQLKDHVGLVVLLMLPKCEIH